jgi:hypothetical protein
MASERSLCQGPHDRRILVIFQGATAFGRFARDENSRKSPPANFGYDKASRVTGRAKDRDLVRLVCVNGI